MADPLSVDPVDLLVSGSTVEMHALNVKATHAAADARIDSALSGWAGSSQAAMTAKAAEWQTMTTALSSQLFDHALVLRSSATAYQQTDESGAPAISSIDADAMGRCMEGD